jgi:hypothetical protein
MERARLNPTSARTPPPTDKVEVPEPRDDKRDAARWRALLNCEGLRVLTDTVQPHDGFRHEEHYRYIQFTAASHGTGGRLSRPALIAFVDHLVRKQ